MKRAIIDIGTNSVLLLIGNMRRGRMEDITQSFEVTRLGKGLHSSGRISNEGINRTLHVLKSYRSLIEQQNIASVHLVGTESLRKAVNKEEFITEVQKEFGWSCSILSGEEEAKFSYTGTTRELMCPDQSAVVIDVGGGSTEIVIGKGDNISFLKSFPVGVVRLAETHNSNIRISESARKNILSGLNKTFRNVPFPDKAILIGSGGTITTLVAIKEKMASYDPEQINGYRLKITEMEQIYDELNGMSAVQRLSLPGLLPGREDVILFGTLIFMAIMRAYGVDQILASDRGLRFGYFYHLEELIAKN